MSPPTCSVNIMPTYISTDLVTPGRRKRETLPALGNQDHDLHQHKLWGQETKPSLTNRNLAYHHFKPSHLNTEAVVVTHRHYGNRMLNMEAKDQPYVITSLLLSKCRYNDQRMPRPFQSPLVQENFIPEPFPEQYRDSYFSHRCKFQVFPTDGVDLNQTELRPKSGKKKCVETATTKALKEIKSDLYHTTTYQHNFELSRKRRPQSATKGNESVEICKKCGLKIKQKREEDAKILDNQQKTEKQIHSGQKKSASFYPTWPPGVKNITNNPPGYPKIILPKYCIHPTKKTKKTERFCCCKDQHSHERNNEKETSPTSHNVEPTSLDTEEESAKVSKKQDLTKIKTKLSPRKSECSPTKREKSNNKAVLSANQSHRSLSKNKSQQCLLKRRKSTMRKRKPFKIECGFKTEAHRRFHQLYGNDKIPDLRDATTEGRKHNFHGFNVHVFRG